MTASPYMACWIAALRVSMLHCARANIMYREPWRLTSTSQMPALKVIIGRIDMVVGLLEDKDECRIGSVNKSRKESVQCQGGC